MANFERGRDGNWQGENDRNQWREDDRFGGYGNDRNHNQGGQRGDWRRGQGAEGPRSEWNRNVAFGGGQEGRQGERDTRESQGGYAGSGGYGRNFGRDGSNDARSNADAGSLGYNRDDGYRNQGNYGANEGRGFRGSNEYGANYGQRQGQGGRDFWDRASDEVSSWFGDDDAERRRERDARHGDSGAQHHAGRGPKGYTRSDERIKDDVSDRLSDDRYVDASEIEVSVSNREVSLTGTVDSRDTKRRAEDIAERVSGVTHVSNNLRVTSGSSWSNATTATSGTTSGASTSSGAGTTGGTTGSGTTTGLGANRNA